MPESMTNNIRKFEGVGTQPVAMRNAVAGALAFHRGLGAVGRSSVLVK